MFINNSTRVIIRNGPVKELIGCKGYEILAGDINENYLLGKFNKEEEKRLLLLPIDKNEKISIHFSRLNIIEYYGRRYYVLNEKNEELYYTLDIKWFDDYEVSSMYKDANIEEVCEPVERIEEEKEEPQSIYQVIEYMIDEKISKNLDKKIDFLIGESLKKSAGLKTRMRMGEQ